MSERDELASSPPPVNDVVKKKKCKRKAPREEPTAPTALAGPAAVVEAEEEADTTMERPKKKKKRRHAQEELAPAVEQPPADPPKKHKRPKVDEDGEPVKSKKRSALPEPEEEVKRDAKGKEKEGANGSLAAFLPASTIDTFRQAAARASTSREPEDQPDQQPAPASKPPRKRERKAKAPVNGTLPSPAPNTSSKFASVDVAELRSIQRQVGDVERALTDRMDSIERVMVKMAPIKRVEKVDKKLADVVAVDLRAILNRFEDLADRLTALEERNMPELLPQIPTGPTALELKLAAEVEQLRVEVARIAETRPPLTSAPQRELSAAITTQTAPAPVKTSAAPDESESDPSEADTEDEAPPPEPRAVRPRLSLLKDPPSSSAPAPVPSTVDPGFEGDKDLALQNLRPSRLSIDAAYLALADDEDDAMKEGEEEESDATPIPSSEPSPKVTRRSKRDESQSLSEGSEEEEMPTRAPLAQDRGERIREKQKAEAGERETEQKDRPETLEEVIEHGVMQAEPDVVTATAETAAEIDHESSSDPIVDATPVVDQPAPVEVDDAPTQTLAGASARHIWTALENDTVVVPVEEEIDELLSQPPTAQPRLPPEGSPTPAATFPSPSTEEPPATIDPAVLQPPTEDGEKDDTEEEETPAPPPSSSGRTKARVRTYSRKEPPTEPPATLSQVTTRATRSSAKAASQASQPSTPQSFALSFDSLKKARTPRSTQQPKTLSDLEAMTKEQRLGRLAKNKPEQPASTPVAAKDSRLARLTASGDTSKAVESASDESESE